MRVGPNDLVTSSPELLAHMSGVRSPYTRSKWYNRATRYLPGKDHVFSELDEEKHKQRRQQMAHGVSYLVEVVLTLIKALRDRYTK